MRQGWGERELDLPPHSVADVGRARRATLADAFPVSGSWSRPDSSRCGQRHRLPVPRGHRVHVHLTGNQTSDAVLVVEDGESVLYARPRSSRQTDEFFRDRRYGEPGSAADRP